MVMNMRTVDRKSLCVVAMKKETNLAMNTSLS